MMSRTRLTISAVIIAFVILTAFALSVPHTRDIGLNSLMQEATTTAPAVTVQDAFRKGTHTLSGSLMAVNACTTVSAEAAPVTDASSTSILLSLTVEELSGVCLELPTEIEFETTVSAPADLPITVTVNGAPAEVNPS